MTASRKLKVLMTVAVLVFLLAVGLSLAGPTNNLTLVWDWTDSNTNGIVYRGKASGTYTTNFPVYGTNVFSDYIPPSTTYYYVVVAVNMFGDQSAYSSELAVQRVNPTSPGVKYVVVLK
jgi:hypothetical protein